MIRKKSTNGSTFRHDDNTVGLDVLNTKRGNRGLWVEKTVVRRAMFTFAKIDVFSLDL